MEKHRYKHTPKSFGGMAAVKWTGKNFEEVKEVFEGKGIFSKEHGRLIVKTQDGKDGLEIRTEVLQGNYLVLLDEPTKDGVRVFALTEEFFEEEHTPLKELEQPKRKEEAAPLSRKERYDKAILEVLDYERDYPKFKPNKKSDELYGCLLVPIDNGINVIVGGYGFPKTGNVTIESSGGGLSEVTVRMKGVFGHKNLEEPED